MYVAQIAQLNLTHKAGRELSKEAYDTAADWLTQWTPDANFKAVIAETRDQAVEILSREPLVPEWLARYGVRRDHFTFQIRDQEVTDGCRFWIPMSLRLWVDFHFSSQEP